MGTAQRDQEALYLLLKDDHQDKHTRADQLVEDTPQEDHTSPLGDDDPHEDKGEDT